MNKKLDSLEMHEKELISCDVNEIHKTIENLVEFEKVKYQKNNTNL